MVLRLSICELYRAGRFLFPPKYLLQPFIIELLYLLALCFSLAMLSLVLALVLSFIVHLHLNSVALKPLPVPSKEPSVGSSQLQQHMYQRE